MKNYYKNIKAFTLVEVLLYIGLLSFFLLVITGFISLLESSKSKNAIIQEVDSQGTQIMEIFKYYTEMSNGMVSPAIGDNANSLTLSSSSGNLVFSVVSSDLFLNENSIDYKLNSEETKINTLEINNYSFDATNQIVRVRLIIGSTKENSNYEKEFISSFTIK